MTLRTVTRVLYVPEGETTPLDVTDMAYAASASGAVDVERVTHFVDDGVRPQMTVRLVATPNQPVAPGAGVQLATVITGGLPPFSYAFTASAGAPALAGSGATRQLSVPVTATDGASYTYTVRVADSSAPPLEASASHTVGVEVEVTQPDPLTATINQTPASPVTRNATVLYQAAPLGGTPPYTYVWTKSAGSPAWTGTGASRQMVVPATATDQQTWTVTATVTDAGAPAQSVTTTRSTRVTVITGTIRTFAGKKPQPRVGMSSPDDVWPTRWNQVQGAGRLTARRIFGDYVSGGRSQQRLIEDAIEANLLPVVSYKGTNLTYAEQSANYLKSLGVPVTVTYNHEPTDDMTAAQFIQRTKDMMPMFKHPLITRMPFINGWHLDNQQAVFNSYCPDELFEGDYWESFGIDTYQAGDSQATQKRPWPGDRIPLLRTLLKNRGYGNWQVGIGEYNGWIGDAIRDVSDKVLSITNDNGEPFVWLAMMWNATTGKGIVLDENPTWGNRLAAFRDYTLDNDGYWKPENTGETVP